MPSYVIPMCTELALADLNIDALMLLLAQEKKLLRTFEDFAPFDLHY